jgi:hypothetical protein
VTSRFNLLWDSKFVLHEHRTVWADRDWLLRPGVEFVDRGQHLTVDEYADVTVPDRKVYDDHSIMGDYYNEGIEQATAKLRHGERLAAIIGASTGKDLKARSA